MTSTQTGKHILIGGGSGFVGRALTRTLLARGDRVTWVSRTKESDPEGQARLTWDEIKTNGIPDCDVVINLAGKHILDMRRRWSAAYRDEVLRSRIETTQALVQAINARPDAPALFISTAGKCFYGSQGFKSDEEYFDLDERSEPIGVDYPARLVNLWENAADDIDAQRVRHVKLRLGIVLDSKPEAQNRTLSDAFRSTHGIFPMLHAAFKRGLCLAMGSGVQPFPWVHVDDVVGIFLRAIDQAEMQGIFNVVAPGIVSNRQFTEMLSKGVGRSVLGHIPGVLIKAFVGLDRSTILLLGQRVKPTRTLESGYRFRYPDLGSCLDDLLASAGAGS